MKGEEVIFWKESYNNRNSFCSIYDYCQNITLPSFESMTRLSVRYLKYCMYICVYLYGD